MTYREVELLAIGAGPSNLALAVALEELAPEELATNTLLIEQGEGVAWQRGMLLEWARSQVSFLKDLVTLRDPRSRFSFLNYLHDVGRLDDFVNMGSFTPYRSELSEYLKWVAESLSRVQVEFRHRCTNVEPRHGRDGTVTGWVTQLADGSTIGSRYLVLGTGRDAHVPLVFAGLPADRVVHSTQYRPRVVQLPKDVAHRIAVIGGAQSAAEMFYSVKDDLPHCRPTMIMRSIGLNSYESSKFTNELYKGSFVGEFFEAGPEARAQLLTEMHRTNYAGLSPELLDTLYREMYLDRLSGRNRMDIKTMTDVTRARVEGDEVVLELKSRKTGAREELRCDVVLLGTGFDQAMPALVRQLGQALGLERIEVTRTYRLRLGHPATGACYLQGVNEATHGIADSLLSVLAHRGWEIADEIFQHRAQLHPTRYAQRSAADVPLLAAS